MWTTWSDFAKTRLISGGICGGKVSENWDFTGPRKDAQTWHYFLYLASLDEPGAYEALAAKLASTKSGNDLVNLLTSLAELRTPMSKEIIGRYAKDTRRDDDPDGGTGRMVAETVKWLLSE